MQNARKHKHCIYSIYFIVLFVLFFMAHKCIDPKHLVSKQALKKLQINKKQVEVNKCASYSHYTQLFHISYPFSYSHT